MFATFPRTAVTSLTVLSSFTSVKTSFRFCAKEPSFIAFCATVKFTLPVNALTLILPAGAVNDHLPCSSASVYPIGIQYVSSSRSSAPSPENASLSTSSLTPARGESVSSIVT